MAGDRHLIRVEAQFDPAGIESYVNTVESAMARLKGAASAPGSTTGSKQAAQNVFSEAEQANAQNLSVLKPLVPAEQYNAIVAQTETALAKTAEILGLATRSAEEIQAVIRSQGEAGVAGLRAVAAEQANQTEVQLAAAREAGVTAKAAAAELAATNAAANATRLAAAKEELDALEQRQATARALAVNPEASSFARTVAKRQIPLNDAEIAAKQDEVAALSGPEQTVTRAQARRNKAIAERELAEFRARKLAQEAQDDASDVAAAEESASSAKTGSTEKQRAREEGDRQIRAKAAARRREIEAIKAAELEANPAYVPTAGQASAAEAAAASVVKISAQAEKAYDSAVVEAETAEAAATTAATKATEARAAANAAQTSEAEVIASSAEQEAAGAREIAALKRAAVDEELIAGKARVAAAREQSRIAQGIAQGAIVDPGVKGGTTAAVVEADKITADAQIAAAQARLAETERVAVADRAAAEAKLLASQAEERLAAANLSQAQRASVERISAELALASPGSGITQAAPGLVKDKIAEFESVNYLHGKDYGPGGNGTAEEEAATARRSEALQKSVVATQEEAGVRTKEAEEATVSAAVIRKADEEIVASTSKQVVAQERLTASTIAQSDYAARVAAIRAAAVQGEEALLAHVGAQVLPGQQVLGDRAVQLADQRVVPAINVESSSVAAVQLEQAQARLAAKKLREAQVAEAEEGAAGKAGAGQAEINNVQEQILAVDTQWLEEMRGIPGQAATKAGIFADLIAVQNTILAIDREWAASAEQIPALVEELADSLRLQLASTRSVTSASVESEVAAETVAATGAKGTRGGAKYIRTVNPPIVEVDPDVLAADEQLRAQKTAAKVLGEKKGQLLALGIQYEEEITVTEANDLLSAHRFSEGKRRAADNAERLADQEGDLYQLVLETKLIQQETNRAFRRELAAAQQLADFQESSLQYYAEERIARAKLNAAINREILATPGGTETLADSRVARAEVATGINNAVSSNPESVTTIAGSKISKAELDEAVKLQVQAARLGVTLEEDQTLQEQQILVALAAKAAANERAAVVAEETLASDELLAAATRRRAAQAELSAATKPEAEAAAGGGLLAGGGGGLLFGAIAGYQGATVIKKLIDESEALQVSLNRVKAQFDALGQGDQFAGYRTSLLDIAKDSGEAAKDVVAVGQIMKGAFADTPTAINATKEAVDGMQVLSLSAAEAQNLLVGSVKGFGIEGPHAIQSVTDEVLHLGDVFGVSGKEVLTGTASLAALGKELGLTFNEVATVIAAAAQNTGKGAGAVANDLQRILPNIQKNAAQILQLYRSPNLSAQLPEVSKDLATGKIGPVLIQLFKDYDKFNESQKAALITLLGGSKSAETFAAALGASKQVVDELAGSQDHAGRTAQALTEYHKTLTAQLKQVRQAFQELGQELIKAGIGTAVTDLVQGLGILFKALGLIVHLFSDFNSALGGIPARLAEIALGLKALQAIGEIGFIKNLTGSLAGFGSGIVQPGAAAGVAGSLGTRFLGGSAVAAGTGIGRVIPGAAARRAEEAAKAAQIANETRFAVSSAGEVTELAAVIPTTVGASLVGVAGGPVGIIAGIAVAEAYAKQKGRVQSAASAAADRVGKQTVDQIKIELRDFHESFGDKLADVFDHLTGNQTPKELLSKSLADKLAQKATPSLQALVDLPSLAGPLAPPASGPITPPGGIGSSPFTPPTVLPSVSTLDDPATRLTDAQKIDLANQGKHLDPKTFSSVLTAAETQKIVENFAKRGGGKADLAAILKAANDGDESARRAADLIAQQYQNGPQAAAIAAEQARRQKANDAKPLDQLSTPDREVRIDNNVAKAKADFQAGTGGNIAIEEALRQQIQDYGPGGPLASQADSADKVAAAQKDLATTISDAAVAQRNVAIEFAQLAGTDTPQGTIDILSASLDSGKLDPKAKLDTAKEIVKEEQAFLKFRIEHAGTQQEALDLIRNGLVIPKNVRAALIAQELNTVNEQYQKFLATIPADIASFSSAVTNEIAGLVANGRSIAEATVQAYRNLATKLRDLAALKSNGGGLAPGQAGPPDPNVKADASAAADLNRQADEAQAAADRADAALKGSTTNVPGGVGLNDEDTTTATDKAKAKFKAKADAADAAAKKAQKEREDTARAQFNLEKAQAEGDPVAIADAEVRAAQLEIQIAQTGTDADKINAQAHLISAQKAAIAARGTVADAYINLDKAQHLAAGDTVAAAQDEIRAAQLHLDNARARGDKMAEVAAQAELVSSNASAIKTQISSGTEEVDTALALERITTGAAIEKLRILQQIPGETQKDIDALEVKIRALQKGASADFAFNLPSDIKLPTLYEVRRANQTQAAGQSYQDARVITINFTANNTADSQAIANDIVDRFSGPSRFGAMPRSY